MAIREPNKAPTAMPIGLCCVNSEASPINIAPAAQPTIKESIKPPYCLDCCYINQSMSFIIAIATPKTTKPIGMARMPKPMMNITVAIMAITIRGMESTRNGMLHPGKLIVTGLTSPVA